MSGGTSSDLFGDKFGGERMWGLKELDLPEILNFVPQTIGWLYVFLLLLSLAGILAFRRYKYWRSQAYRREALKKLVEMEGNPELVRHIPRLLRSAALHIAEREKVVLLHGVNWIKWLNETVGEDLFSDEDASLLNELAYSKNPQIGDDNRKRLISSTREWVRGCHA